MKYIDEYLVAISEEYPASRVDRHFRRLKYAFADFDEDNFDTYTADDIIQVLAEHITTYTQLYSVSSHFRRYCEWCINNKGCSDHILDVLDSIVISRVWKDYISKIDSVKKKYITNEVYEELIDNIEFGAEYNPLFYKTLIMCIYEGVWDINWETLNYIRVKDIDVKHHSVHIKRTNQDFILEISPELVENLIALSKINYWERPNRNGICQVKCSGMYPDSIFRLEQRSVASKGMIEPQMWSRRLRKITEEFNGNPLKAQDIYISGIMYRIKEAAESEGITLNDVFKFNNKKYGHFIQEELERTGYNVQYSSFRVMVQALVDYFN